MDSVQADTLVKEVHLFLQVGSVLIVKWKVFGRYLQPLGISPQQQQVMDAQKVQVEQGIFGLLTRKSLTDNVRDGGDAIFVLDGSRNGHGARTLARSQFPQTAVVLSLIDHLTVMRGDVDILRVKLPQLVYHIVDFLYVVSFQRRKYLKREHGIPAGIYRIYYFH